MTLLPDPEEEESDVESVGAKTQENLLYDIRQELREMRNTVREIIREELQRVLGGYLQFYSNKIDDYETKMHEYENRIKLMDNQLKNCYNVSKNLQYDVLKQRLNKWEQAQICNNISVA